MIFAIMLTNFVFGRDVILFPTMKPLDMPKAEKTRYPETSLRSEYSRKSQNLRRMVQPHRDVLGIRKPAGEEFVFLSGGMFFSSTNQNLSFCIEMNK